MEDRDFEKIAKGYKRMEINPEFWARKRSNCQLTSLVDYPGGLSVIHPPKPPTLEPSLPASPGHTYLESGQAMCKA